jgi:uncharacterized Zn-finger protein
MKSAPAFEIIEVATPEVACDGGGGPLGHPRVWLHIDRAADGQVTCLYCSRLYHLKAGAKGGH